MTSCAGLFYVSSKSRCPVITGSVSPIAHNEWLTGAEPGDPVGNPEGCPSVSRKSPGLS